MKIPYKPAVILVEKQSRNGVIHITPVSKSTPPKRMETIYSFMKRSSEVNRFLTEKTNGNCRKPTRGRKQLIRRVNQEGKQALLRLSELMIDHQNSKEFKELANEKFYFDGIKYKLKSKFINKLLV